MLVIGSRAMQRAFGGAREALDWDLVATPGELEALASRLRRLPGIPSTRRKAYFLYEGVPLEVIIATPSNAWSEVLAYPSEATETVPALGRLRFASGALLLLLKTAHAHLAPHWEKTVADVDFLASRVALDAGRESLLARMRTVAEEHCGPVMCAFPDRFQVLPEPASSAAAGRRRRMVLSLGGVIAAVTADGSGSIMRRALRDGEALPLLRELTMVRAAEELYAGAPVHGAGGESSERHAVDDALRALCTREMGRSVRIALAPHAEAVRRSVAPGFSVALVERANATGDDVALSLARGHAGSRLTMSDRYLNL